jgi:hypothetical protein
MARQKTCLLDVFVSILLLIVVFAFHGRQRRLPKPADPSCGFRREVICCAHFVVKTSAIQSLRSRPTASQVIKAQHAAVWPLLPNTFAFWSIRDCHDEGLYSAHVRDVLSGFRDWLDRWIYNVTVLSTIVPALSIPGLTLFHFNSDLHRHCCLHRRNDQMGFEYHAGRLFGISDGLYFTRRSHNIGDNNFNNR